MNDTTEKREVRCLMAGLELRAAADDKGPGTAVGYAAVFDKFSEDLGYFREKIAPGAFSDVLDQDVRALVNHDVNQLIGRSSAKTLRMTEDELGLRVEIDLPDTEVGRSAATLIKRGDLSGMSFSFDTEVDQWDKSFKPPVRTLIKVATLYDVGPVAFPAYGDTKVAMRSLSALDQTPDPDPLTALPIPPSLSPARAALFQRLAEATSPL
jgi:HK97 family phage prohead protease